MTPLIYNARVGHRPIQGGRKGDLHLDVASGQVLVWTGKKWVAGLQQLRRNLPAGITKVKLIPVDKGVGDARLTRL